MVQEERKERGWKTDREESRGERKWTEMHLLR